MKIKVDVDETLRNILPTLCDINNEITGEHKTVDDFTTYDVEEVFPNIKKITGKSAYHVLFEDNCKRVFEDTPAFEGTKDALLNLHNCGWVILIVTNQPKIEAKIATLNWLSKNDIYYDEIHFTYDKKSIKANAIVDDNPDLLDAEPEEVTKIKINKPYNKNTKCNLCFDSIKDCGDWYNSIYEKAEQSIHVDYSRHA